MKELSKMEFATRDHEGRTVRSFATRPATSYLASLEAQYDATVLYEVQHSIRCGSCYGTHTSVEEIKDCYAQARADHDEYLAEAAWDAECDVAFARSREAISESGSWFGYDSPGCP